jgi:hypothetical protein
MKARIELSLTRTFVAAHSLPTIGLAQPHEHSFELRCGYSAAVDAEGGCERPLQQMTEDVDAVVSLIERKDLNALLPVPPTAEMLSCWILARLPDRWQWAAITAYGGYTCKVDRADLQELLPLMGRADA